MNNHIVKVKVKNAYEVKPFDITICNPPEQQESFSSDDEEMVVYEPSVPIGAGHISSFSETFVYGRTYDIKDYITWTRYNVPSMYQGLLDDYKWCRRYKINFDHNINGTIFTPLPKAWYKHNRKVKDDYVHDLTIDGIEPNPGPLSRYSTKRKNINRHRRKPRGNQLRSANRKNKRPKQAKSNAFQNDKTSQNIAPEVCTGRFGYIPDFIGFNGSNYGVKSFKMNDFWDIDPAILSTIIAGLKRYTDYYYQGLVLKFKMSVVVQNKRGTLMRLYIIVSLDALDAIIATYQTARDVCENNMRSEFVTEVSVGSTPDTSSPFMFSQYLPNMTKKGAYLNSEIYNGLYNASPVYPFYVNFVAYSIDSGDPLDIIIDSAFSFKILFMEFRTQDDTGPILLNKDPVTPRVYKPYNDEQSQIYDKNKLNWRYYKKDIKFKDPAIVAKVPTSAQTHMR